MSSRSQKLLFWTCLSIYVFLTFVRNLYVLSNACFHTHDFALFIEALQKMAAGTGNPFLLTRQLHFFSDHWEPIFYFVALVWKFLFFWIPAGPFLLIFESLVILSSILILLSLVRKDDRFWVLCPFLFLHFDLLAAVRYPVRPSSWAILPLAILIWMLVREKDRIRQGLTFISVWRWFGGAYFFGQLQ